MRYAFVCKMFLPLSCVELMTTLATPVVRGNFYLQFVTLKHFLIYATNAYSFFPGVFFVIISQAYSYFIVDLYIYLLDLNFLVLNFALELAILVTYCYSFNLV